MTQLHMFLLFVAVLLIGVGLFVYIGTRMIGPEPEDDK